ncbi:MAG: hypothetical protein WC222_04565 [Parachlamydiales bacterium]|jgi:hypothetical protein
MNDYLGKLIKYPLNLDKTIDHFVDYLLGGNTLSTDVVQHINLKKGVFFTLLPESITEKQLYEFSYGGVLPQLPQKEIERFSNFQPTPTLDIQLAEFVSEFIRAGNDNSAIFAHTIAKPTNIHIGVEGGLMSFYKDEVYYIFQEGYPSVDVLADCIFISGRGWHFLCILTENMPKIGSTMFEEDFKTIYEKARYIIIGAYDNEGYIFWQKEIEEITQ